MKTFLYVSLFFLSFLVIGCSVSNIAMKQPDNHIEFYKGDFDYSPQVQGEATVVKIFMIDWARLFNVKSGEVSGDNQSTQVELTNLNVMGQYSVDDFVGVFNAVIPVIGNFVKNRANQYALYEMMKNNPGYDIVLYPQYASKKIIIPFFYSKTKVKATARLGKIK